MGTGSAIQIVTALVPLLVIVALFAGILFVTGQRAARQLKALQRLQEDSARQTALLQKIEEHLRRNGDS